MITGRKGIARETRVYINKGLVSGETAKWYKKRKGREHKMKNHGRNREQVRVFDIALNAGAKRDIAPSQR